MLQSKVSSFLCCVFLEYTKDNIGLIMGNKPLDKSSALLSDYGITSKTQMLRNVLEMAKKVNRGSDTVGVMKKNVEAMEVAVILRKVNGGFNRDEEMEREVEEMKKKLETMEKEVAEMKKKLEEMEKVNKKPTVVQWIRRVNGG